MKLSSLPSLHLKCQHFKYPMSGHVYFLCTKFDGNDTSQDTNLGLYLVTVMVGPDRVSL